MNLPRPIPISNTSTSNQYTARNQIGSTVHDSHAVGSPSLRDSQPDEFEKLIKQLERDDLSGSDSSSDDVTDAASATDNEASTDAELLEKKLIVNRQSTTDEQLDALKEQNKKNAGRYSSVDSADCERHDKSVSDSTAVNDLSASGQSVFPAGSETLFSRHAESTISATTSPVINDAAARIIEEMQLRMRRGELRRWQFSLPGLMGGDVSVVVENLDGQSWHVKLTMPNGCSDEDRLALTHRLSQQMDNVSLSVGVLGE